MKTKTLAIDDEFQGLIPPLSPEELQGLQESILSEGCRDPLVVWDGVILDGHNRYKICQENGLIYSTIEKNFDTREDAKIWIIRNQMGRRNLTDAWQLELRQEEKRLLLLKGKQTQGKRTDIMPESGRKLDRHSTRKELAEDLGWSTGKLSEAEVVQKHQEIWDECKKGTKSIDGAYRELKRNKQRELKNSSDFKPKSYDVWNFIDCDKRFGTEYPGQIPGQILQNVLYYFTIEGDLVVDLMAGGGVTNDVCQAMGRHCLSYDVQPSREFIIKHDFRDGLPKEAKKANLIFLDPPYFKKKEEEYGEKSISALNRKQYLESIDKLALVCQGHKVAFVMGKYLDYKHPEDSIFISEYVNIFEKHGFRQIDEISINQMPPEGGQYDVIQSKKQKRMCILKRDLIIFEGRKDG